MDFCTGLLASNSVLGALAARERTGRGQHVAVSLYETGLFMLVNVASNYLAAGREAGRYGNGHPSIVPYTTYPTRDGMMAVAVGNDGQFAKLAQAVGRWGNWFNQELFGEPTDRPWGLEIDLEHRPLGYLDVETFHPVFLYEFGWNLLGVIVLLVLDRFVRFRPPALFALYVAWYTAFRAYEETIRIDAAGSSNYTDADGNLPEQANDIMFDAGYYDGWVAQRGVIANPLLWTQLD